MTELGQQSEIEREHGDGARPGRAERVPMFAKTFVANNWRVMLYVLLIILCVVFAPEQPLKFIYTEF